MKILRYLNNFFFFDPKSIDLLRSPRKLEKLNLSLDRVQEDMKLNKHREKKDFYSE